MAERADTRAIAVRRMGDPGGARSMDTSEDIPCTEDAYRQRLELYRGVYTAHRAAGHLVGGLHALKPGIDKRARELTDSEDETARQKGGAMQSGYAEAIAEARVLQAAAGLLRRLYYSHVLPLLRDIAIDPTTRGIALSGDEDEYNRLEAQEMGDLKRKFPGETANWPSVLDDISAVNGTAEIWITLPPSFAEIDSDAKATIRKHLKSKRAFAEIQVYTYGPFPSDTLLHTYKTTVQRANRPHLEIAYHTFLYSVWPEYCDLLMRNTAHTAEARAFRLVRLPLMPPAMSRADAAPYATDIDLRGSTKHNTARGRQLDDIVDKVHVVMQHLLDKTRENVTARAESVVLMQWRRRAMEQGHDAKFPQRVTEKISTAKDLRERYIESRKEALNGLRNLRSAVDALPRRFQHNAEQKWFLRNAGRVVNYITTRSDEINIRGGRQYHEDTSRLETEYQIGVQRAIEIIRKHAPEEAYHTEDTTRRYVFLDPLTGLLAALKNATRSAPRHGTGLSLGQDEDRGFRPPPPPPPPVPAPRAATNAIPIAEGSVAMGAGVVPMQQEDGEEEEEAEGEGEGDGAGAGIPDDGDDDDDDTDDDDDVVDVTLEKLQAAAVQAKQAGVEQAEKKKKVTVKMEPRDPEATESEPEADAKAGEGKAEADPATKAFLGSAVKELYMPLMIPKNEDQKLFNQHIKSYTTAVLRLLRATATVKTASAVKDALSVDSSEKRKAPLKRVSQILEVATAREKLETKEYTKAAEALLRSAKPFRKKGSKVTKPRANTYTDLINKGLVHTQHVSVIEDTVAEWLNDQLKGSIPKATLDFMADHTAKTLKAGKLARAALTRLKAADKAYKEASAAHKKAKEDGASEEDIEEAEKAVTAAKAELDAAKVAVSPDNPALATTQLVRSDDTVVKVKLSKNPDKGGGGGDSKEQKQKKTKQKKTKKKTTTKKVTEKKSQAAEGVVGKNEEERPPTRKQKRGDGADTQGRQKRQRVEAPSLGLGLDDMATSFDLE